MEVGRMKKFFVAVLLIGSLLACQQSTPPTITTFKATPASLPAAGGTTKLEWSVSGATTLEIDGGVGVVTGTGKDVTVTSTKTFTLTAKNTNGTVTATTTVEVARPQAGSAKLKLINWPSGQTGKLKSVTTPSNPIGFPTIDVAADGTFEYTLSTPTPDQVKLLPCNSSQNSLAYSNPAAKFAVIGGGVPFAGTIFGDGSATNGAILIANQVYSGAGQIPNGYKFASLLYSTQPTKVTGGCGGVNYDFSVEEGWNYFVGTIDNSTPGGVIPESVKAFKTLPTDMNWYYLGL
jgi:hypothetical protein